MAGSRPSGNIHVERVIVVEADPLFRKLLLKLLNARFYVSVVFARDLEQAVRLLMEKPQLVRCVIFDDVAAQNGGQAIVANYLACFPDLNAKFILFSTADYPGWRGRHIRVIMKNAIRELLQAIPEQSVDL